MYLTFCLLPNILAQQIIGHGSERGGALLFGRFWCCSCLSYTLIYLKTLLAIVSSNQPPLLSYTKPLFHALFNTMSLDDFQCETCTLAKCDQVNFPLSLNKISTSFTLVHFYLQGPTSIHLFVTFIDDYIWMTWLYLLRNKSNVLSVFRSFHVMA